MPRGRSKRSVKEERVRDEVRMIMRMWLVIERTYGRLSEDDRKRIEIEAAPCGYDVKFKGFGGIYEAKHRGVAYDLAYSEFREFNGRDLKDLARLNEYRRLLGLFDIIRGDTPSGDLSVADLIALLKERIHPDYREQ